MKIFNALLFFLLSCTALIAEQQATPISIVVLENNSELREARVRLGVRILGVKQKARKACALMVPFVAWKNHCDAEILGKPYIPAEALRVVIGSMEWGIWSNELGLSVVPLYIPDSMSREEAIPVYDKGFAGKYKLIITDSEKPQLVSLEHA